MPEFRESQFTVHSMLILSLATFSRFSRNGTCLERSRRESRHPDMEDCGEWILFTISTLLSEELPEINVNSCEHGIMWKSGVRVGTREGDSARCVIRESLIIITMTIGEHSIEFSTSAKNLGVIFDSELGMDLHVNNITRSCFYQLRQLRSMVEVRHTSAALAILSERSEPGLTCDLLFEAT